MTFFGKRRNKIEDSDDKSDGHRKLTIDIEVEVTDGFPDPATAKNPITSIAIYDDVMDQYSVFLYDKTHSVESRTKDGTIIESYGSEQEMLQNFFRKYLEIKPTIITGWNIDYFDIPYLYNRCVQVMGEIKKSNQKY